MENEKMKDETNGFKGKIAIATNDQKRVTGHIGRCRGFMIYEIDGEKIINKESRENQFTNHRMGGGQQHHHGEGEAHRGQGHGRHSHEHLINGLKDCSYLISSGGGWRVVEDLKQHNITTLFTNVESIDDAVNKFIIGELKNETDLVCDHNEN
jgi:predicted Fe-Mo cluster-binding NifX family protein